MSIKAIEYKAINPEPALADFVDNFWMIINHSEQDQPVVIVPDGRIDIIFSQSATEPYHALLMGLGAEPDNGVIEPQTIMFAVSLKLPGVEYILHRPVASLLNKASILSADYWNITANDLNDFDLFCKKATQQLLTLLSNGIDSRKRKLFDLIYNSNGSTTVQELSAAVYWSSRQINRYFNEWFGLSLKAYLNILRFRASIGHIAAGKLFPEKNFTDQAHFIKNVKKYTGALPKELHQNKNDRFIQFSTSLEE